ncbi:putative TrmJ-related RNA methyltransferase [Candidatus Hepatincolaceae symbiont of Richtersius coronifer]
MDIILVNPQLPENIGMVARAMLNFEILNLVIINPREKDFMIKAQSASCGAFEKLNLKVFPKVSQALQEYEILIAFSARVRNLNKEIYDLKQLFNHLKSISYTSRSVVKTSKIKHPRIGVLFGQENNGLCNEDVAISNLVVNIDCNPNFSSLNLSQAVGLFCYEYHNFIKEQNAYITAKNKLDEETIKNLGNKASCNQLNINIHKNKRTQPSTLAPYKEVEYFMNDLISKLEQRDFFSNNNRKQFTINNLRSLYAKAQLTEQEVKTLIGMNKMLFKDKSK